MSTRIPASQQPLFELDFDPREHVSQKPFVPWTEYGDAKQVAMVMSPEKGTHVEIDKRRRALIAVLGHLASASKMIGLQAVSEMSPNSPARVRVERRYGKEAPEVFASAPAKQFQSEQDARHEFGQAYGYQQMVEYTGSPVETSEDFAGIYDKFQDIYADSKGNKARKKLRRQLEQNESEAINTRFAQRAIRMQLNRMDSK